MNQIKSMTIYFNSQLLIKKIFLDKDFWLSYFLKFVISLVSVIFFMKKHKNCLKLELNIRNKLLFLCSLQKSCFESRNNIQDTTSSQ